VLLGCRICLCRFANWSATVETKLSPTFGQLFFYDSPNQHGVIPKGFLWAVSGTTWTAYDAMTGVWLFSETGVPSGTNVYGPNGEIMRYVLGVNGMWLAAWNNTEAAGLYGGLFGGPSGAVHEYWRPVGQNVDASKAYSWNITLAQPAPFMASINFASIGDILLGSSGFASVFGPGTDPYAMFAISLKPTSLGQVLWTQSYPAPAGNVTRQFGFVDTQNRVFILLDKETTSY
jgi:hypothetical protein